MCRLRVKLIDEVNEAIAGPKVHAALPDGDANAGVVLVPRVGGLLGSRNYRVLGLLQYMPVRLV